MLMHVPLLLLWLSRFSCVRLFATPETAVHQAPPSIGFSRKEHWSRLPFSSPMHESEVTQSCPTLRDPMDCSLPGSSIHGIFQARVLEWVVIAFFGMYHWDVLIKWYSTSVVFFPKTYNPSLIMRKTEWRTFYEITDQYTRPSRSPKQGEFEKVSQSREA